MLQSLVITLREGVEAALVVGIVLTYLRRTGREAWSRVVFTALGMAIGASIVAAVIVDRLQITEEIYEGWLLLVGCGFVFTMVLWMWRTGRHLKREIETRLEAVASREGRGRAVALFLLVFLMVFREGIETVLFLAAVSLETTQLLNFMGGILGLGLAVFLGVGFAKGTLKVNLPKFFRITTIILLVVGVQLLIAALHELSEAQIIPSGPRVMAVVGPLVNHDAFFFLVIVGLSLILLGLEGWRKPAPEEKERTQLGAAERRLLLAERGRQRFWVASGATAAFAVLILISAEFVYSRHSRSLSPPVEVNPRGEVVGIPLASLEGGILKRFRTVLDGEEVRYLAIRDPGGKVHVALDACLICGPQGYYQDGAHVVCANCAAAVYVPSIGLEGGCNPIAVEYRTEEGEIILSLPVLKAATRYFR